MLSNSKLAAVQEIIEFLAAQAEAVLEEEQEGQGFRSLAVTFILSGAAMAMSDPTLMKFVLDEVSLAAQADIDQLAAQMREILEGYGE